MSQDNWYVASAILYLKYKEGSQDDFEVLKKNFLIEAQSQDEAWVKAEKRALECEGDDNGILTYNGRPARRVYVGLREVLFCDDEEQRPTDSTELTFSEFTVESEKELEKLSNGETVTVFLHNCSGEEN